MDAEKKSLIFTDAEMEAIKKRKQGDRTDKTGIFFGRVKPKIEEMLNLWFSEKKTLLRIIAPASRKKNKKEARSSPQQ